TAGNASQEVPADGSFTMLLDRALSSGGDHTDGYITGDDVVRYVTRNLPQYQTVRLSPQSAKIPRFSQGDFIFGPVGSVVASATPSRSLSEQRQLDDAVRREWSTIRDTTSVAILEEFIRRNGGSEYASYARARLEELKKAQVAVVLPPVAPPSSAIV